MSAYVSPYLSQKKSHKEIPLTVIVGQLTLMNTAKIWEDDNNNVMGHNN